MEQIITSDHRKHDNHLQVTLLFFPSLFLAWLPQQTRQKDFQCGSPKTEKRREFLEILGQGRRDHLRGSDKATELSQQLPRPKDAARLTLLRTVRKPHIHL